MKGQYFFRGFLLVLLSSCGYRTPHSSLTPNAFNDPSNSRVYLPLPIELIQPTLEGVNSRYKLELRDSLRLGRPVNFMQMTEAVARDHFTVFEYINKEENGEALVEDESSFDVRFQLWFSRLMELASFPTPTKGETIEDGFKMAYESKLKPLTFNGHKDTIFNILLNHEVEPYSGTILFILMTRMNLSIESYAHSHFVVIFESNHILPGYVKKEPLGYHLYGIETSVEGKGVIDYGLTSKLHELKYPLLVVDAEYFFITELYKNILKNPDEIGPIILKYTKEKYKLSIPNIKIFIPQYNDVDSRRFPRKLATSIFSLGELRLQDNIFNKTIGKNRPVLDYKKRSDIKSDNTIPINKLINN